MWSLGGILELDERDKLQEFMLGIEGLDLPSINKEKHETIFEYFVEACKQT